MSAAVELSIVIPTFNTSELTLAACRAALDARVPGTEVIVVDDASTDNTSRKLAAETPEIRIVRLDKNVGFAGAANAGVAAAHGRFVLLLNSDTRIDHAAPRAFLDAFQADPRLGVAGARLLNADASTQWSGGPRPTLLWLVVMISGTAWMRPWRGRQTAGQEVDWVSGAAMAFRRETWNDAGPLREHYRFYAQDLDFCMRARAAGWKVRIVDDARVAHAGGSTVQATRETGGLPHDPERLWLDLLTWGEEHYGPGWTLIALPAARSAASIRIAARRARELFLRGEARDRSRAATDAYSAARKCLTRDNVVPHADSPSSS